MTQALFHVDCFDTVSCLAGDNMDDGFVEYHSEVNVEEVFDDHGHLADESVEVRFRITFVLLQETLLGGFTDF